MEITQANVVENYIFFKHTKTTESMLKPLLTFKNVVQKMQRAFAHHLSAVLLIHSGKA